MPSLTIGSRLPTFHFAGYLFRTRVVPSCCAARLRCSAALFTLLHWFPFTLQLVLPCVVAPLVYNVTLRFCDSPRLLRCARFGSHFAATPTTTRFGSLPLDSPCAFCCCYRFVVAIPASSHCWIHTHTPFPLVLVDPIVTCLFCWFGPYTLYTIGQRKVPAWTTSYLALSLAIFFARMRGHSCLVITVAHCGGRAYLATARLLPRRVRRAG